MRFARSYSLLTWAVFVVGCSTAAETPAARPNANGAGTGGVANAGTSATLPGGAPSAGKAGNAMETSGAAGVVGGGSLGGSAGSSGAGGAAGAAGAGSLLAEAAALEGVRWELTCGATVEDGRVCEYATDCAAGTRINFDKTVVFGGEPGQVYQVTLRWRGVVEPHKYLGGQADGTHFRVGGTPDPDASTNLFGVYSVEVSAPHEIYYLNDDTQTGHYVFPIDHTKTIDIEGGARLHLLDVDQVLPCYAARNCDPALPVCTPFVIDGVGPAPAAFNGQFIEMNVVSVVRKP